ncbi:MAG: ATP-binding cassette domain-containing protein [Pseudomonadota bacterium]
MIRVEGLLAEQGDFALRAAFDVPRGRRVAVAGPSGAGKSTLLAVLGGYTPVTAGKIIVDGVDVTARAPDARGIAMLFQDGNLFPHLSVAQNVGLGVRPSLRLDLAERQRVHEALAHVGLSDLADRKPGALSGGQQSRAALARVLLQSAPVLLLDEPFAALGPALRAEMLSLTSEVVTQSGATMLMVTHAPLEVAGMVDDLIFVDAGDVAPPAPAAAVLADPPPALRAYLGG